MTYLASPYSHPDASVREQRFQEICTIAAELIAQGEMVFCPISHSHPIATIGGLPENNSAYWGRLNRRWMECCTELRIAKMDGWQASEGIARECDMARELGLPISFIEVPR